MNEDYLSYVKDTFKDNFDVKYKTIKRKEGIIIAIFIDNLSSSQFISEYIVQPLILSSRQIFDEQTVKDEILSANIVGDVKDKKDTLIHILSGDVVLIADFFEKILFCEAKQYNRRSVNIPLTEGVVKGPREGFTEAFVDNVSLIRRKVKNPDLKFETLFVGDKSNTTAVVVYIKGVAPERLVQFVSKVVKSIKNDFILDTNCIEEELRCRGTVFDTVGYSEKADVIASKILEGRVGVIIDGTPFVVTVPYFFIENIQMPDDYYYNKTIAFVTRLLRWTAFFIATLLPGLYIALTTVNYSLIPQVFVFRLAVSRAEVPFPTVVETFLMILFFQILREAGIRLPQPVGQAMGIVGALILGDAAVGAGIASQVTLIIVALSSISSFLVPKLYWAINLWSVFVIILSSLVGLPGFYVGFMMLITHTGSLNSCGYPYLYPLVTYKNITSKDLIHRGKLSEISNSFLDKGEEV